MPHNPNWLQSIKALCIDINGVLYECGTDRVIKGSIDALTKLNQKSFPYSLLTNETSEDLGSFTNHLNRLGFNLRPDKIISPAPQVARYVKEKNLRPFLLIRPELRKDFEGCNESNPNCVVIGDAAQYFTYESLNQAFRILMNNKDASFIAMGKSKFYQENGELILDQGAFVTGLEYATDRSAMIIGKPSSRYFEIACQRLGFSPNQIAMIGDDIRSDVKAAQEYGMRGILVRTGKYRRQFDELHASIKPDLIVDNLAEFVDKLLE